MQTQIVPTTVTTDMTVTYQDRQPSYLATVWQVSDQQINLAWMQLRQQWLNAPKGKGSTNSPATRQAYEAGTMLWLRWLADYGLYPWEAVTEHCRSWAAYLKASGYSDSTVAQRLAAVSSWYSFVINQKQLRDGQERCLFEDSRGIPRANPFRANEFKRPNVDPYDKAHLLSVEELQRLFAHLLKRANTVAGARNYALLLAHMNMGIRSSEFCRLRWSDIEANWDQPGSYLIRWAGKGGKTARMPLPEAVYHAIVAYLKLAGRWAPSTAGHIGRDEFIFPPLRTDVLSNLRHVTADSETYDGRHITSKSVQRIFKTALRQAKIANWDQYRIHDIRHTLAVMLHKAGGDLNYIKNLLHHSTLAITEIYIRDLSARMVKDTHSAGIMSQLGLPIATSI